MNLGRELSYAFLEAHAAEAAQVLESRDADHVVQFLRTTGAPTAAQVVARMAPGFATHVLHRLSREQAAQVVDEMPLQTAIDMLRRMEESTRQAILTAMPDHREKSLRASLDFPAGTAGALMDPRVTPLPDDLTVREALDLMRRTPEHLLYNVYIVDRNRVLVGVINLQELLGAQPRAQLGMIMQSAHHRLTARMDAHAIVSHPGWREVYSLPVVDADGKLIGAVRHRTVRRLEQQLALRSEVSPAVTVKALGDLFWTGVGGVVDAVANLVERPEAGAAPDPSSERPRR